MKIIIRILLIVVFLGLVLISPIEILFYVLRWVITGRKFPEKITIDTYIIKYV